MKSNLKLNRLSRLLGIGLTALSLSTALMANNAFAQNDPPGRIARVGYSYGQISFADAGSNQWTDLMPNRPISIGDSVFVGEQSRAELHVGNSSVRLNENTRLSFINLTDDVTQIQLSQGTVVLRVRALSEREVLEINTPNLNFSIQEPGDYRININYDNTTTVIVRRGIGVAQGDRDVITIREGEQTRFAGTNLNHSSITRAPNFDTFDQWAYDRDRAEENSISARYVPRDMIGYQQLDEYGTWETHAEYGAVWYPRVVTTGWAPYRDGRWVWVAPWGWTWVDRSPWGFAPYHYGRWAYIGNRWAWCPGRYERHHRPVYAPALVAFVGASKGGVSVGITVGSKHTMGPAVSWYPLGPGESYRPHYTQNPRYIQNINQTIINNTVVVDRRRDVYGNRNIPNAVTSVPQQTFVRGDHVFTASRSIPSNQTKQLQVLNEAPNLQPEKQNRFGDARPRTWENNQQFQNRATVAPVENNIPLNDGKMRDASRFGERDRVSNNTPNYSNTQRNNQTNQSGNVNPQTQGMNYISPVERAANGTVVQYPQRPEHLNPATNSPAAQPNQVPNNNLPLNTAPQNRVDTGNVNPNSGSRFNDDSNANRIRPRYEEKTNLNPEFRRDNIPATSVQAPSNSSFNPQPVAIQPRPAERPIERNERIVDRQERLIERGNERPVERPQASFAPRQEPVRPVEVKSVPTTPPVTTAAPTQAVQKKDEKTKEKSEDRGKRYEK